MKLVDWTKILRAGDERRAAFDSYVAASNQLADAVETWGEELDNARGADSDEGRATAIDMADKARAMVAERKAKVKALHAEYMAASDREIEALKRA